MSRAVDIRIAAAEQYWQTRQELFERAAALGPVAGNKRWHVEDVTLDPARQFVKVVYRDVMDRAFEDEIIETYPYVEFFAED